MRKVFAILGRIISFRGGGDPIRNGFTPYADAACNRIYNLAFCDKLELFREEIVEPVGVWATLLAKQPYAAGLQSIANDRLQQSRLRLVACRRLESMRQPVASKELLGAIIETGTRDGLNVLAVYLDGCVLYLDHRETQFSFDPVPDAWMVQVNRLLDASREAVERIGPWQQPRVAPPTEGMLRVSFLVSDGLYFGQGLLTTMEKDAIAAPIVAACADLLRSVNRQSNHARS